MHLTGPQVTEPRSQRSFSWPVAIISCACFISCDGQDTDVSGALDTEAAVAGSTAPPNTALGPGGTAGGAGSGAALAAASGNGTGGDAGGGDGNGMAGLGGETSERVVLPDPVEPAASDPDFAIQGEYRGALQPAGAPLAAQIIALGNGEFRAVFEPGGLPGEGFEGVKVDVDGRRDGETAHFAPDIDARAVDTGGQRGNYTAMVSDGVLTGTDESGQSFTLRRVIRESPTLAKQPPEGAVVLFNGTNTNEFIHGEPNDYPNTYFPGEGGMTADGLLKEGATTLQDFRDCLLHVEFRVPFEPDKDPNYRGNSGVYLQGAYEVNILDSLGLRGAEKDNGVIWGVRDPDVNMSFPPLSWQTFDIDFVAARYAGGEKIQNARMTVYFNGILVHDDVEIPGATSHNPLPERNQPGPVFLQANPFPVRFRYIWVLPN